MAPADSGILHHRRPLFTEAGTALHTALSENPPADPAASIASLNSSTSSAQSQNTTWSFPSHSSPSSLSSPPYTLPGHSNHPSPSGSAHSPSNTMIGATPTFYDPEHEAPPQTTSYHEWSYEQQHQLPLASSSTYPPHPPATDSRPERQAQPTARHHNQYQFVSQHPLSTAASDTASFNYLNIQSQFDDRQSQSLRAQRVAQPIISHAQDWTEQSNNVFGQGATASADAYFNELMAPFPTHDAHDEHHARPTDYLTPNLATPVSDSTLQSAAAHVSPGWGNPPLPSPSSNTPTSTVIIPPRRKDKNKPKRKRQNTETDDDDDDDAMGQSVDPSLSRPNPNRLPGACTYCKRLKMKCYFPPGENVCKRCRSGKHDCIVEGRKPRSAPNKREYLLAQMRQKDELIDSLLKQLHNPYLATPLSIEAYRNATSSADQHRQNVIAWLDRLQTSVRSPVRAGTATNPFQLDPRAGKGLGQSDESDEEQASQKHAQPRRSSSGSEDTPVSPNTLVESDIDPYPDDAVPIGLLANLAISSSRDTASAATGLPRKSNNAADDDEVGVAAKDFFAPGPALNLSLRKSLIDKTSPPDILVHKLVTTDDVEKLFEIFYTRINPFISLLEPKLHTPAKTFSRCPFLFTVVCAISLRYSDKPEVYPIAMHFAKSAASSALIDGWKTVELCQAYILMSIYAVPARRWEEDRSWLYTGLAIRIATDLNLHLLPPKKPTTELQELEMLNRTRIWIICFNLDKSTATQFGKPSTVKEDYIVRKSHDWYKSSQYNHPYDVHIIAYTSLFRIVNKFHQEVFSDPTVPNGLNRSIDFRAVTLEHDRLLESYRQEWAERFQRDSDHSDAACEFRVKLLPFYSNYARLVMFSFGFQKAFQRGFEADDEVFFTRSLESAKEVVTVLVDTLVPTGYIRFAPDGYFVFASFASAFMLKLLRPECSRFITPGLEEEIYQVIERLINTIGSPQIAIDERHTPKLYSRFLASLLAKHKRDGAANGRMHQQGPPPQQMQTGSNTPVYHPQQPQQQQQQQQQQPPPPRNVSSSSFGTGVSNANTPNLAQSVAINTGMTSPDHLTDAAPNPSGNYIFDQSTDFTFGGQDQPNDLMDFTFDPITAPGNDEMLAAMQAIQNPTWWRNMMMPGFFWPAEEQVHDHTSPLGNGIPINDYQTFQPQAAEV